MSSEAQDLITQLCIKDPLRRLCCAPERGVDELRKHPFFADFDWMMLFCRRMPSPLRGSIRSNIPRNLSIKDLQANRRKFDSYVANTLTEEQQVTAMDSLCTRSHAHHCIVPYTIYPGFIFRF
jgi:hypothetical protein